MRIGTRTLTTNVEVSGREGAPAIVLSHSLGSSAVMWAPQLPALEPHFRVVRYDTRGHGASDAPGGAYTLAVLAEDVAALLDALGIGQAHFLGLSMGGMIGQTFALLYPERLLSLILCSTSAQVPAAAQPVFEERITTARTQGMSALVEGTLARWFTEAYRRRGTPELDLIRRQFLATPAAGFIGCCEAIRRLDLLDRLAAIRHPVLIMVGEDDPGTPVAASQAIHGRIVGSKLAVLPQMLHLNNIEAPQPFNRHLMEFLGRP